MNKIHISYDKNKTASYIGVALSVILLVISIVMACRGETLHPLAYICVVLTCLITEIRDIVRD